MQNKKSKWNSITISKRCLTYISGKAITASFTDTKKSPSGFNTTASSRIKERHKMRYRNNNITYNKMNKTLFALKKRNISPRE